MLPSLELRPRGSAELVLLALLVVAAAMSAVATRLTRQNGPRFVAILGAYVAGLFAALLAGHALLGASVFVVSPYAATLVVGVLASWALEVPRLRSIGLPLRVAFYAILGCLVFGVFGSRLANALADLPYWTSVASLGSRIADRGAGLGVFGAFAADTLFLVALFRRYPEHSLARMLDASASIIAFNMAVGRIGCLLAGCCYGAPTQAGLFAIPVHAFQPDSPAGLAYSGSPNGAIWATQPMESVALFAIALCAEMLFRRRARLGLRDGAVIASSAAAYGATRAALETIRADSPHTVLGALTVWQALGLSMCAASLLWIGLRGKATPSTAAG